MTLQEFIPFWQAQPFRPFALHTTRGIFSVVHPLRIGMSPHLEIALVVEEAGETRVELFPLIQITGCEVTGQALDLARTMAKIDPETLARESQILAAAIAPVTPLAAAMHSEASSSVGGLDPGAVTLLTAHATDGVFLVHATVSNRDGEMILSTAGTRWNLHGLEQFENGTSLYLHHLDHPTVEQRIILWPPDRGTFESFAESKSAAALGRELRRHDKRLTRKPARVTSPKAAYFRHIQPQFPSEKRDGKLALFGADEEEFYSERFQLEVTPYRGVGGSMIRNPRITDLDREEILFDLTGTEWHTETAVGTCPEQLVICHPTNPAFTLQLALDFKSHIARVNQGQKELPLAFIQRHLTNFSLYEPWEVMYEALLAGPREAGLPDVVLPGVSGFQIEMWAGEPRYRPPFLQPHIVNAAGETLLDFRGTTWAGWMRWAPDRPELILRFMSEERENREAAAHLEVFVDLVSHRVRCPALPGSTTLGMLQAVVRHVRGVKWMQEALPQWLEKGRRLPVPETWYQVR